jgi:hypothetical protein
MEYLDNLITRLAAKCIGVSPGGVTEGTITVDSTVVTVDSTVITVDNG